MVFITCNQCLGLLNKLTLLLLLCMAQSVRYTVNNNAPLVQTMLYQKWGHEVMGDKMTIYRTKKHMLILIVFQDTQHFGKLCSNAETFYYVVHLFSILVSFIFISVINTFMIYEASLHYINNKAVMLFTTMQLLCSLHLVGAIIHQSWCGFLQADKAHAIFP